MSDQDKVVINMAIRTISLLIKQKQLDDALDSLEALRDFIRQS